MVYRLPFHVCMEFISAFHILNIWHPLYIVSDIRSINLCHLCSCRFVLNVVTLSSDLVFK